VRGINLSRLRLLGTRGLIDKRYVYEPIISQKVSVRIEVRANSATVWRSTQYPEVSTDAKGQFCQVHQLLYTG
jgi:hypothetical protein